MIDEIPGGRRDPLCPGVSRRGFVPRRRAGALGLALPACSGGALWRRGGRPHAGRRPPPGRRRVRSRSCSCSSGWSVPPRHVRREAGAPEEVRGKFGSIPTNVAGLRRRALLHRMARTMDKVCLVRSQSHDSGHHEAATNRVLSGRPGSPFGDHPSMGAVVAHRSSHSAGDLPPYVAIPRNPAFMWELGKSAGSAAGVSRSRRAARTTRAFACPIRPLRVKRGTRSTWTPSRPRSATATAARSSARVACWPGGSSSGAFGSRR